MWGSCVVTKCWAVHNNVDKMCSEMCCITSRMPFPRVGCQMYDDGSLWSRHKFDILIIIIMITTTIITIAIIITITTTTTTRILTTIN